MTATRRVVRNSVFSVLGEGVGGALNFLIIILVARYLGVEGFGKFSFIFAFVGVFQLVADFGLTNFIIREIAHARDRAEWVVAAVRPLVWLLSITVFALICILINVFSSDPEVINATYVMAVAVLVTFQAMIYASVCRAFEDMGYNAIGFVSHKIALLLFTWLAMRAEQGIMGLAIAYLAANAGMWVYYYAIVHRRYMRSRWVFDVTYWKYLLREAFPIGAAMVLRRMTLHVDTLVLTALSTTAAVGIFNAAYKVVQIVDMIPFTLAIPLYPVFVRLAAESQERVFDLLNKALRLFVLLAVPLMTLILIYAEQIVLMVYGESYLDAVPVLQVLAVAVLFLFPSALYIYLFAAMGRQKWHLKGIAIGLVINLGLDLILVPTYGALGAAVATLCAEMGFFLVGVLYLKTLGWHFPHLASLMKVAGAAAAGAAAAYWLGTAHSLTGMLTGMLAFICSYVLLVLLSGALTRADIDGFLKGLMAKPKQVSADG